MYIVDYNFIHGTELRDTYVAIPELDRKKPAAQQFINLAALNIELSRPTAFLYIDGVSLSPSEVGARSNLADTYFPAIKTVSGYAAHLWVGTFLSKHYLRYVEVLSGTCAAGIQAIDKAHQLLHNHTVEEVIIIGGERITEDTIKLFHELMIPVTCGDGFVYVRCANRPYNTHSYQVMNPKWAFSYNDNPFAFSRTVMNSVRPPYPVDYVKLHGTGTKSNTEAEKDIAELAENLVYKNQIGHTQGVSALLETCIVMDDSNIAGRILVTANGLGGYYGAFTLIK